MSESNIENVAMVGAGTLGGQIAWHSAYMGKQVTVYDISEESLEKCQAAQAGYATIYSTDLNASEADIEATRSRLTFTTDLVEAAQAADLVIEAVPEVPDIKIDIYKKLAAIMPQRRSSQQTLPRCCHPCSRLKRVDRIDLGHCILPT